MSFFRSALPFLLILSILVLPLKSVFAEETTTDVTTPLVSQSSNSDSNFASTNEAKVGTDKTMPANDSPTKVTGDTADTQMSDTTTTVDEKAITGIHNDSDSVNDSDNTINQVINDTASPVSNDTLNGAGNSVNDANLPASLLTSVSEVVSPTIESASSTSPLASSSSQDNHPLSTQATTTVSDNSGASSVAATSSSMVGSNTLGGISVTTPTATATATNGEVSTTSVGTVGSSTGSTRILTGVSIATANIINLLNSNVVNSFGSIALLNLLNTSEQNIDFRDAYNNGSLSCSLSSCLIDGVVVTIKNDASIDNTLIINADSGHNVIDQAGNGVIETGDAYAGVNIVNALNLNLINSQYLLAILNAFGSVTGDLVFPSLFNYTTSASTPPFIATNNSATLDTIISVEANTGNNTLASTTSGTVKTGNATTLASLFNQLNTSLVGGNSISLLLRVHGNWNGEVFGLPEGAELIPTANGYTLNFSSLTKGNNGSSTIERVAESVTATNTAHIRNNIQVAANTGENSITTTDNALISTGNAFAGANIINIANANVIGRNWILGIINIFGDFTGNLAFGRPDLWVGGSVEVPRNAKNNDMVTYTYTVTNRGDSPAKNVSLRETTSDQIQPQVEGDTGVQLNASDRTLIFSIGTLDPGETKTVHYRALITGAGENSKITNTIVATEHETDNDVADNSEVITFYTAITRSGSGGGTNSHPAGSKDPTDTSVHVTTTPLTLSATDAAKAGILKNLTVLREPILTVLSTTKQVATEKLTIINNSSVSLPDVTFIDQLTGADGVVVQKESWYLGTILPHEEIVLSYTFNFDDKATAGTYLFSSIATNPKGTLTLRNNGKVIFALALALGSNPAGAFLQKTDTTSLATPTPQVAGASTSTLPLLAALFPVTEAAEQFKAGPDQIGREFWQVVTQVFLLSLLLYALSRITRRSKLML